MEMNISRKRRRSRDVPPIMLLSSGRNAMVLNFPANSLDRATGTPSNFICLTLAAVYCTSSLVSHFSPESVQAIRNESEPSFYISPIFTVRKERRLERKNSASRTEVFPFPFAPAIMTGEELKDRSRDPKFRKFSSVSR